MVTGLFTPRFAAVAALALGFVSTAHAVTTATFDGGGGAGTDTFPGSAGNGWAGGFVNGGAAPAVTNSNTLNGTDYLSYTAQASGGLNIIREYDGSSGLDLTKAHTIAWQFRFDAANLSQCTAFEDRIHFFASASPTTTGGTSNANSWSIFVGWCTQWKRRADQRG